MTNRRYKLQVLLILLLASAAALPAFATTFQYVYDDIGQLTKSIDSEGNVVEYVYDKMGNRLEVKRYSATDLAIFGFTPANAPAGSTMTLQGQGFSLVPSENKVTIGGVEATVLSATENVLVVQVPTTGNGGEIVVTVNKVSASANKVFAVSPKSAIQKIVPAILLSKRGANFVNVDVKITGANLALSDITFLPEFSLPLLKAQSIRIADDGKTATINIEVKAGATGSFTLLASNSSGRSETLSTAQNTVTVYDELTDTDHDLLTDYQEASLCTQILNPDTDGDGFSDKDEIDAKSNPCDAQSIPTNAYLKFALSTGNSFTVRNEAFIAPVLGELNVSIATSSSFTVMNQAFIAPDIGALNMTTATSTSFTVMNNTPPQMGNFANDLGQSVLSGPTISVQNTQTPVVGSYADSSGNGYSTGTVISVQNTAQPTIIPVLVNSAGAVFIDGPAVSIRNDAMPPIAEFGTATNGVAGGAAISIKNGP